MHLRTYCCFLYFFCSFHLHYSWSYLPAYFIHWWFCPLSSVLHPQLSVCLSIPAQIYKSPGRICCVGHPRGLAAIRSSRLLPQLLTWPLTLRPIHRTSPSHKRGSWCRYAVACSCQDRSICGTSGCIYRDMLIQSKCYLNFIPLW